MKRTIVAGLAACFLVGGVTLSLGNGPDQVASNMALGRRVMTEIYGGGKVELVDQLYTDDFVDDSPGGGKGRETIKKAVVAFHQACPDLHMKIEDVFATENKVVIRYVGHGKQTGPFGEIPPTGKTVAVRGISVFEIKNDKINTEWTEYDRLGMLRQLGVVPSPAD